MKAIILAAGEGVRLHPITLNTPKAMIHVFGKPLLAHNMDKLVSYVDEFILVVKYKQEIIRQYFWEQYQRIPIKYHIQGEKKWTAWALIGLKEIWECFILASDTIFHQNDIDNFVMMKSFWVLAKRVSNTQKYGIFQVDKNNVLQKIIEKPQIFVWNLASLFYFKLHDEIIKYAQQVRISERGEYDLTDALNMYAEKHHVIVHEIKNDYIDITSIDDLNYVHNFWNISFWETRYIENIGENELYFWINTCHIEDILQYTSNQKDNMLQKNTSDQKRFLNKESIYSWYHEAGRRVFTLVDKTWKLLWITYFRPTQYPNIVKIFNTQGYKYLETSKHISTWAIRMYPHARWKWLAVWFLKISERVYRSEFCNTCICVDIEKNNIPSIKCFERNDYIFVWYGENKKSVDNIMHERCIYIKYK